MTKIEKQIIKLFLEDRDIYNKYNYILTDNTNPIINIIISQIDNFYNLKEDNNIIQEDIIDVLKYSNIDSSIIEYINIVYSTASEDADSILSYINNKYILQEINKLTNKQLESGEFDLTLIDKLWEKYDEGEGVLLESDLRLGDLVANRVGYHFILPGLKAGLGDMVPGDAGIVFAKVETGKTGFVIDSVMGFIDQGAKVCHFNNEDPISRLLERYFIRYFGVPNEEIYKCIEQYTEEFSEQLQGKLKLYDSSDLRIEDIEKILKKEKPDIFFIDQTDNMVRGEKSITALEVLYYQVRALAKRYECVGISCTQAKGEAYGALDMNSIYFSGVAKQAHTDFIVGIGVPSDNMHNVNNVRIITTPKNKLTSNTRVNFNATYNPILMKYEQT